MRAEGHTTCLRVALSPEVMKACPSAPLQSMKMVSVSYMGQSLPTWVTVDTPKVTPLVSLPQQVVRRHTQGLS